MRSQAESDISWCRRRSTKSRSAWITLFPDQTSRRSSRRLPASHVTEALDRDPPDAMAVVGYARPESMAAARWARVQGRPVIIMSESQAIDRPHAWWKEMIKKGRVRHV